MNKKKLLALLMALVMTLSLLPVTAFASETAKVDALSEDTTNERVTFKFDVPNDSRRYNLEVEVNKPISNLTFEIQSFETSITGVTYPDSNSSKYLLGGIVDVITVPYGTTTNQMQLNEDAGLSAGEIIALLKGKSCIVDYSSAEETGVTMTVQIVYKDSEEDPTWEPVGNPVECALNPVAKIGTTGYATLADAIDAANSGNTITLLQNISVSEPIMVGKSITIDGDGKTITSSGNRGFRINTNNVDVTIKNLTIDGTKIERAIQVDTGIDGVNLTIDHVTATATYYTVNIQSGVDNLTMNITDSNLTGWAAINSYCSDSTIAVSGSTLHGINVQSAPTNDFATIVLDGGSLVGLSGCAMNTTLAITDCTIIAEEQGTNKQYWISYQYGATNNAASVVSAKGTSILNAVGGNDKTSSINITGRYNVITMALTEAQKTAIESIGYTVTVNESDSGKYDVVNDPEIFYYWTEGTSTKGTYCASFYNPFKGPTDVLMANEGIELLKDVTLTENVTFTEECSFGSSIAMSGGTFTLTFGDHSFDLNGHTFTLPVGVSCITDKQTNIFSAPSGYKVVETENGDGTFTYSVAQVTYVAQIGNDKYETLQDAIDAVEDNNAEPVTIQLLDDVAAGSGLATDSSGADGHKKNIIIDLGGHTYTVEDPAVGSTNTKSQAMHWTQGSTIVLKNGTITTSENATGVKMFLQNYADLTLQDVTLDASNIPVSHYDDPKYQAWPVWYGKVVPLFGFNVGSAVIEGKTTIKFGENSGSIAVGERGGTLTINSSSANIDGQFLLESNAEGVLNISAGKYASDPRRVTYMNAEDTYIDCVASGKTAVVSSGRYQVVASGNVVATVGDANYTTFSAAIKAVKGTSGKTVVLVKDQNLSGILNRFTLDNQDNFTLDLGGHTLVMNGAYFTLNGADLTVINGRIETKGNMGQEFIVNSGTLTIGDGATVIGTGTISPIGIFGAATVNTSGTLTAADSFAIAGNGSAGKGGYTINVTGGTVSSAGASAIYHPNNGTLNVSGGTITGATGIYQKSGTMNITGGTINGNGAKADYSYNGNGANATGDAIVIDNCGYPGGAPSASITGGIFASENAAAVGSYNGNTATAAVTNFITGGKYDDDSVKAYVAEGYEAVALSGNETGWYQVGKVNVTQTASDPDSTTDTTTYTVDKTVNDETNNNQQLGDVQNNLTVTVQGTVTSKDASSDAGKTSYSDVTADSSDKSVVGAVSSSAIASEKIQEVIASVVAAAQAADPNATNVSSKLVIVSDNPAVVASTITYEVHPEAIITTTVGDNEYATSAVITNDMLSGQTFTIKLPVPSAIAAVGETVKVTHRHSDSNVNDEVYELTVEGTENDAYVTVTGITSFSDFELAKITESSGYGNVKYAYTLELQDSININFYVNLASATDTNISKYTVQYRYKSSNWSTATYTASTAEGYKYVVAECAAKEMTVPVQVRVLYEGVIIKDAEYTVEGYCDYQMKTSEIQPLKDLCQCILDFGAAAQTNFNFNTGNMATKNHPATDLTGFNVPEYLAFAEKIGVSRVTGSVNLESRTGIVVYFTPNAAITAYSVSYQGNNLTENTDYVVQNLADGRVRFEIKGKEAYYLDEDFTVSVTNSIGTSTVTYCPLDYAYGMRNSATTGTLAKALYCYWNAAKTYFNYLKNNNS